jgi:hypothetical protein
VGYDADENEDDFLDYLARTEGGFLGDEPRLRSRVVSMDTALREMVFGPLERGDIIDEDEQ